MRFFRLALVLALLCPLVAVADPGDQWILGIHDFDQFQLFAQNAGAGYSGTHSSGNSNYFGNSYQHSGGSLTGQPADLSRIYWELSGNSVNTNRAAPTTMELYKIEYWGVTQQSGRNDFHVVESMIRGGRVSDIWPIDNEIPWAGAFGQNHQWIRAPRQPSGGSQQPISFGTWNAMGDGPQAPASASYNAPGDGIYMWLRQGSWLYAKWDFPWTTNRTWSALRLTQITPLPPEPVVGDYNKNGVVDAADYVLWRKTYGDVGSNLPADGFPDGFIDEYDYDVWRERFGRTSGSGAGSGQSLVAVPEPAVIPLVVLAVVSISSRRSRRQGLML